MSMLGHQSLKMLGKTKSGAQNIGLVLTEALFRATSPALLFMIGDLNLIPKLFKQNTILRTNLNEWLDCLGQAKGMRS